MEKTATLFSERYCLQSQAYLWLLEAGKVRKLVLPKASTANTCIVANETSMGLQTSEL